MRKFNIAILLFLFVAIYSLAAQDATTEDETLKSEDKMMKSATVTVKVTPSAEARGVLNLAGTEQQTGNTIATEDDDDDTGAEARIKGEFDYNGIVGGVVELEGDFKTAVSDAVEIGFGDNAYIYAHVLEVFGLLDKSVFDIYLQGGRFEAGFDNAQEAGTDNWLADVDPLSRDNRINMQLDLKIMDMITVRTGLSFAPFDDSTYGNDLGFGVLFEKAFGTHKFMASVGYVVNSTNNRASYNGNPGNNVTNLNLSNTSDPLDIANAEGYYDDLALSLGYQGTFGQIVLLPFLNLRTKGVINKPRRDAYKSGQVSWSAGVKFSYKDTTNSYDLFGLGLDMGGTFNRESSDFYDGNKTFQDVSAFVGDDDVNMNKDFEGFAIKVWSDGLKSVMGKNYLSFWSRLTFNTWVPDGRLLDGGVYGVTRETTFRKFEIGLEQRLFSQTNSNVSLFAELGVENNAPFTKDAAGSGYYDNDLKPTRTDANAYLKFGSKASFTGVITADVK